MPRPKRTLAEADPNASVPAPATKKASTGAASGKENENYRSKTVVELVNLLKERGLPSRGRKAELVQRLEETTKTISRAGKAVMAGNAGKADKVLFFDHSGSIDAQTRYRPTSKRLTGTL